MILIVVAYLLVGNVLSAAMVVSNAQKDLTQANEIRLHTDLTIINVTAPSGNAINLTVRNTGAEIIADFAHTNVFVYTVGDRTGYSVYLYNATDTQTTGSWTGHILNDYIHPGELDPGESMYVNVYPVTVPPLFEVGVCTNNGVYVSTIVQSST